MIALRPTNPERDAPALHSIMGDSKSCRYLSHPPKITVADTAAQLAEWVALAPQHDWVIEPADGGKAWGRVTIYETNDNNWEAGIIICPDKQGRGIATQAMHLAIDRTDKSDAPRRIFADIDPDNVPSLKLFESLGFQHEGRLRQVSVTHIGIRDSVIMSLIATDPRRWREHNDAVNSP